MIRHEHKNGVTETLHDHSGIPEGLNPEECLVQIDRLISSPVLQRSETLCRLVQYLADRTLNSPTNHLKEYQIAVEALGRAPDFDPQLDASVRVQAARLRGKLARYYKLVGIHDPILVDVPKGSYALSFERRTPSPNPQPPAVETGPAALEPKAPPWMQYRIVPALAILAVTFLAGGIAMYVINHRTAQPAAKPGAADRLPVALQTFWGPFLHGPEKPIVVYSNAIFVGSAETGLRYFEPSRDNRDQMIQHYTGVGELAGVLDLDRVFQKSGAQFRIKRGGLFTFDDARSNNLIFVGSPMENLTLRQIPSTQEFVFQRVATGENRGGEVIADLHPRPGESGIYSPTSKAGGEDVDYALIALMPGLDRSKSTIILAGVTTIGTQAAVDYVSNQSNVEELLKRLNVASGSEMKPFEAVLRVKVASDVPMESQLVDLRRTDH